MELRIRKMELGIRPKKFRCYKLIGREEEDEQEEWEGEENVG